MKLCELLDVLDKDTLITLYKSTTNIYSGRVYFMHESINVMNQIKNLHVHNVWYSILYSSLIIECNDYEKII